MDFGKSAKNKILKITLTVSVFIMFAFLYFGSIQRQVFDWDEYNFLKKAYYFDLFVNRNFDDTRWQSGGDEAQPKVGPYIYALALNFSGIKNFDNYYSEISFNDYVVDGKVWYDYYLWKIIPPPYQGDFVPIYNVLTIGRVTSTVFFLSSLVLIFAIALKIKGFIFAVLSVVAIGFTNAFLVLGRVAMTDNMLLFFLYLSLYLLILFKDSLNHRKLRYKTFILSILLGVCAALGAGVKITGILIMVVLTFYFLLSDLMNMKNLVVRRLLAANLVVTVIVFISIFYVLHPYLYTNTLYNFFYMFDGRLQGALEFQFIDPDLAVVGKIETFKLLIKRSFIFFDDSPYVYFPLKVAYLLFFSFGVYKICKNILTTLIAEKKIIGETVFLLWLLVLIFSLPFYLSGDYLRYYLPVISGFVIVGTYGLVEFLDNYVLRKKTNTRSKKVS